MKASISFSEIQDYVLTRFNKPLSINYANDSSVVVDVPFTVFGFTKSIGITVFVLKIEGDDVYLSYSGPMGVDLLVPPAISFVKKFAPDKADFVTTLPDKVVKISLGAIPQAQAALKYVELKAISFLQDKVEADVALR